MGVGFYTEADVYAAARVFTGWNLQARRRDLNATCRTLRVRLQRQPSTTRRRRRSASRSTPDGSRTIPARAGGRRHAGRARPHRRRSRATPRRRAGWRARLCGLLRQRPGRARRGVHQRAGARRTCDSDYEHQAGRAAGAARRPRSRAVRNQLRALLVAGRVRGARPSRKSGWSGFSVNDALTPLRQHGPAAVRAARRGRLGAGPRAGSRAATMLARMNFAATLASNQRFNLARDGAAVRRSLAADAVLSHFLDRLVAVAVRRRERTTTCGRLPRPRAARGPARTRS